MRWILIGSAAADSCVDQLRAETPNYSWDVVISDEFFAKAQVGDAVNLWLLDVFPALALEFFNAQLLPASLIEAESQADVCGWITQQVGAVRRPIIDSYVASAKSQTRIADDKKSHEEQDAAIRGTDVAVTAPVLVFIREFLAFLHEFLIGKFPPSFDLDADLYAASLWLGQPFEIFLKEKTQRDLESLRAYLDKGGLARPAGVNPKTDSKNAGNP